MFSKLSSKLKKSVEDANKPPEMHTFVPPIGLAPHRADSVGLKYRLHKPACTSGTTVYQVVDDCRRVVMYATGKYTVELVYAIDITGTSGDTLLKMYGNSLSGHIIGLDPHGQEIFRFKEQISSLRTKYVCEFVDTISAHWHSLVIGGSFIGQLNDRCPIVLDGRVMGHYEKVTTGKENMVDAILSSVLPITEGVQDSNIELLIAPGVDATFMIAIAVSLDHMLTNKKQASQILGSG